jgi:hypothetical protein
MDAGHEHEPVLVNKLIKFINEKAVPARDYTDPKYVFMSCGRFVHSQIKFLAATPDRLVWDCEKQDWYSVVECKSRHNDNSGRAPTICNLIQMHMQMLCTGIPRALYVCDNIYDDQPVYARFDYHHGITDFIMPQISYFIGQLAGTFPEPAKRISIFGMRNNREQMRQFYRQSIKLFNKDGPIPLPAAEDIVDK